MKRKAQHIKICAFKKEKAVPGGRFVVACVGEHERPAQHNWREAPLATPREKPTRPPGSSTARNEGAVAAESLSRVQLSATPRTATYQVSWSFAVFWGLLKLMSTESVMPSNRLILCHPLLLLPSIFPSVRVFFRMSQLFASGGQSMGVSASASVLPVNLQGWFPLGLTGLISLQSKGLSRVFSNTTVWKHQFFGFQPSLWSNTHICTRVLEKPLFWLYGPLSAKWCP